MAQYGTGWSPIQEFETGAEVSTKFNTAFENIDIALDALEVIEPKVDNNTSDISTLTQVVNDNTTNISKLMGVQYEYSILSAPIDITDDVNYTPIVEVEIPQVNDGIFEYKLSIRWSYSSTNSSAMFRYAIIRNDDTNPTWFDFNQEVKDKTDNLTSSLFYPVAESNGDRVKFALEGKVETSGQTLTVGYADVIIDQKK
jgi:hypothetical protein